MVNVGVSTRDTFPSGNNGYVFTVNEVVGLNTFTTFVGPNDRIHNYVSGGNAQINYVRPYDGQVVYLDEEYKSVKKITISSGGSGYTSPPTITIGFHQSHGEFQQLLLLRLVMVLLQLLILFPVVEDTLLLHLFDNILQSLEQQHHFH